jgi:hypothetical protein
VTPTALVQQDRAQALRTKAAMLFTQFNEAFWDDELGCYAYALDGDKKKVLTVSSNMGHCLWCGLVPPERARLVVQRLMAPDMWTGWGIRTLSSLNPAFNPYNYQTGSVWPHDNAIIALGFKYYGYGAEAAAIAHDISKAASHCLLNQLPELYTAFERDETTFPVQYIGANVPQAWAAGSAFMLVQALLGFLPDAPRNRLYIDPLLPAWLPDLTVRDLRIGQNKFAIRFWREGGETAFEVIDGDPALWNDAGFPAGADEGRVGAAVVGQPAGTGAPAPPTAAGDGASHVSGIASHNSAFRRRRPARDRGMRRYRPTHRRNARQCRADGGADGNGAPKAPSVRLATVPLGQVRRDQRHRDAEHGRAHPAQHLADDHRIGHRRSRIQQPLRRQHDPAQQHDRPPAPSIRTAPDPRRRRRLP